MMQITEKLNGILSGYMPEETVFLCENRMLGRRILAECAKESLLLGVRAETPLSLALEVCSPMLDQADGWTFIGKNEAAEVLFPVLQQQKKEGFLGSPSARIMASAEKLYSALQEVEMADIALLQEGEKQQELQQLREAYQNEKKTKKLLDRADLFRLAIELVEGEKARKRKVHYLTLGAFSFTPLELRFVNMLTENMLEVVPVGIPEGVEKPKDSLEQDGFLVDAMQNLQNSRFFACRGTATEVRSVFKDILKKGRAFEECAIVYLSGEYGQLCQTVAGRFGVPVTISGGVPMTGSLLYHMLQQVAALPQNSFHAEEICTLLESQAIHLKQKSGTLVNRLRKKRIGWGDRGRYQLVTKYEQNEKHQPEQEVLEAWDHFFDLLFAVAGGGEDTPLEEQKKALLEFLEKYTNRMLSGEAEAYVKATEIVRRVSALHEKETLLQKVIGLFARESYQSGNAEAGKVFCMPLSQALCTGRKYVYVVGNSRYSIHGGKESPILLDAERTAYPALKTVRDRENDMLYRYLMMLAQQDTAEFTFTYPDFDSGNMLEVLPSPLFLKIHQAAGSPVIRKISYLAEQKQAAGDFVAAEKQLKIKQDRKIDTSGEEAISLAEPKTLQEQLKDFVYSPSSLEMALKCPFQFYMQKVLKLYLQDPPRRRENGWLERNTIGSFCHEVLENFYKEQPEMTDLNTKEAQEKLSRLFDASFETVLQENPPVRKELIEADKSWARDMIIKAIEWTQAENRTVLDTEKRFGTSDDNVETEGLKLTVNGREFRLQGSIDRVDRLPARDGEEGEIVVLDYKTGDVKKMEREKDLHLQDYLYPLALNTLEKEKYNVKNAGYLMLEREIKYLPGSDKKEQTEKIISGLLVWLDDEVRAQKAAPGFRLSKDGKTLKLASEEEREQIFMGCKNYCKLKEICPMNRKEGEEDDAD